MNIRAYLSEAFTKKELTPKEGNNYSVKGTTIDGEQVYTKYARSIGKDSSGNFIFQQHNDAKIIKFVRGKFIIGPPNWKTK